MAIIINQIKAKPGADKESIIASALKISGIKSSRIEKADIYKTSLDARRRNDIHYVHSVIISLKDSAAEEEICRKNTSLTYAAQSRFEPVLGREKTDGRIVIAGFGPAGMFCGLALAEMGYRPLILERGECIEKRMEKVNNFWQGGELDTNSNVQFGEGGAGTFSDGKLTTRIKDPLCRYVLERFAQFGAPKEILTKAKPHIGTDKLREIVKSIRERIIECGGEIRFSTMLDDIVTNGKRVEYVKTGSEEIKTSAVVLAIGHSARESFEMLCDKGIFLEAKPFSVGARIEHTQEEVDRSLYGEHTGDPYLPQGEYQLSYRENGRAVYTFCMCPGGFVVPAASENGGIVTNGMSEFARNGKNANSAMVVSVTPEDFGNKPLDGMYFARSIEQKAYDQSGSFKACATTVMGFLNGRPDLDTAIGPSYALGVKEADFTKIFPEAVTEMMKNGFRVFGRKMQCFKNGSAILSAPETRTSSPVRMTRNSESLVSISCDDLYPCGEGAGYAGGIMSAAVDGLNVALKIMERFAPCDSI